MFIVHSFDNTPKEMDLDIEYHSPVIGSCRSMCPESEIKFREKEDLLHFLELTDKSGQVLGTGQGRMIKEYSRPAAGKGDPVPSELRPGPVLLITTTYLINRVVPLTRYPWHSVYEFVFDRLRAVRQDMTIQQISDSYAVRILEHAIRVMIYAHYRLCEEPPRNFDSKINSTHIQECLKKLLNLYDRKHNCHCNMGEFVSLYMLFNLGSTEALQYALSRKRQLRHNGIFKLSLEISLAWWTHNYVRCIKLCRLLPVLHICAFHNQRAALIRQSLWIMSSGYNSKNLCVPLRDVTQSLGLSDIQETQDYCQQCGIQVISDHLVKFNKTNFKTDVKLAGSHQQMIEEDLAWEDLSMLLLGTTCQCVPHNVISS